MTTTLNTSRSENTMVLSGEGFCMHIFSSKIFIFVKTVKGANTHAICKDNLYKYQQYKNIM
jgi:hypothetical protein